ncbi:uncharacterized protein BDW47DRAFT_114437 [Aspergillus candidus]|uniref:Uncharacterized protein n=1 Tax=Aspergillus candidus TaxID=41067 RepID=A0A2I2EXV6_ASPCN|nr:hypothetical protein BDW47DRAFT_114437 [Aspergillus candidus]PLB33191.1 hypothetical protein BDW47DRAFT_114437 [Aspergillus candidus]
MVFKRVTICELAQCHPTRTLFQERTTTSTGADPFLPLRVRIACSLTTVKHAVWASGMHHVRYRIKAPVHGLVSLSTFPLPVLDRREREGEIPIVSLVESVSAAEMEMGNSARPSGGAGSRASSFRDLRRTPPEGLRESRWSIEKHRGWPGR